MERQEKQWNIRSQKIINSASNFHLKTEHERDEDSKSPEHNRAEAWRKPRMPYNKLPQAFQMKVKKDKQDRKKTNKEAVENIDNIVKNNEYKEVQKYLDPIKLEKKSEEDPRDISEIANPLAEYQKCKMIIKRFNDNLKEQDISINKFKTLSSKPTSQPVKLNECITLDVIKRGHYTGTLKKTLHVPTLRLLCVREQPLNTKESRQAIKEWLIFWQTKLNSEDNDRFINVYGTYFNSPEGAVSVITEYFKRGSLLNLLKSVIREIFANVIDTLNTFYQLTEMHFGGLSPSQIMFGVDGKVRLGMGLFYHFPKSSQHSIYHLKSIQKINPFDFNTTHNKFMKSSIEKPLNLELERSLDTFKLGLIILQCCIGGFENFEQSAVLHENLRLVFSEEGQRQVERDNVCCLIHSETYILENSQWDERSRRDRIEAGKVIHYIKFLKDRFSPQFISFLCHCLKLSHSKRATMKEMLAHSFLRNENNKDSKTVRVQLADLLQISCDWNQQNYIESGKQERMDKFITHILHVLNDCRREVLVDLISNEKDKILNLAKEIQVNYLNLGERLYGGIADMLKLDKRQVPAV